LVTEDVDVVVVVDVGGTSQAAVTTTERTKLISVPQSLMSTKITLENLRSLVAHKSSALINLASPKPALEQSILPHHNWSSSLQEQLLMYEQCGLSAVPSEMTFIVDKASVLDHETTNKQSTSVSRASILKVLQDLSSAPFERARTSQGTGAMRNRGASDA